MKSKSFKKKSLSPLISTILLVVVAVILVSLVLSFGKDFVSKNLDETKGLENLSVSDATYFIHSKTIKNGTLQFNYLPPENLLNEKLTITSYTVLEIPEIQEPISLKEQKDLVPGINLIELTGFYAYSTTTPDLTIQLITSNNTFLNFNVTEPGMVCMPKGNGSEENPYVICTAEDLNNIREDLLSNYILGKDIDLGIYPYNTGEGFEPIGSCGEYDEYDECYGVNYTYTFTGAFDGDGYTISNLYINRPDSENVGLFGYITGSDEMISNLILKDVNIVGEYKVGAIVGYAGGSSSIFNCSSTGSVIGNYFVGSIVGFLNSGYIKNCYASGFVSGIDVGLLVGYAINDPDSCIYDSDGSQVECECRSDWCEYSCGPVGLGGE